MSHHYTQSSPPIIIWIEDSGSGEVHYCPKCGASLDDQEGFSRDLETWICRQCHQFLYGDVYDGESFPGVMWYCDKCGDLLNHQRGFCDTFQQWSCRKCGHVEHFDTIYEFDFDPASGKNPKSEEEK